MRDESGKVFAWYNVWVTPKKRTAHKVMHYMAQLGLETTTQQVGRDIFIFIPWIKDAGTIQTQLLNHMDEGGEDAVG